MELFVDDKCQVYFPGAVICGVFCVQDYVEPNQNPTIKVDGCTCIWKSNTNKEIDEHSMFFQDIAELSPDLDNSSVPLVSKFRENYKIFKFYLVLPNNLPPSHEVPFGHTRYKLEACYDGKTVFKYFSVNQWVGLEKRNDKIVKREKFIVSLFNFCNPIEVVLTLNQTYYLPGETVYVVAMTNNNSWKDVMFSKIFIIQTTKYWKTNYLLPLKHNRVIAEGIRGYLPSGHSQIWKKEPFYIPAVIPTTNTSNNPFNFFEVKYKIKMQIVLKNSRKKIVLNQKLFIGNWDKSNTTNSKNCVDMPTNNGPLYEITAQECPPIKLECIDFVPKYVIYETNRT